LLNISILAISVGLPVAVNNPVPASQVGFQNSVQFKAFASKVVINTVIVGTPVMTQNFLLTVLSGRPVTSLGHQEGRRVFREGPNIF